MLSFGLQVFTAHGFRYRDDDRSRGGKRWDSGSGGSFSNFGGRRDRDFGGNRPSYERSERGGGNSRYEQKYPLPRNQRLEEELFGSQQNTGINFDKYDDIPVETSGKNVPDPIDNVSPSFLFLYFLAQTHGIVPRR